MITGDKCLECKERLKILFIKIKRIFFSVCTCNSKGSIKYDNSECTGKCCNNDGTCTCKPGYTGSNCQNCQGGYILLDVVDNEKNCTSEYIS